MSDIEFIKFLCYQINEIVVDGNEPDMETIIKELEKRNVEMEEVFPY